jgi:hypothetical protein
LNAWLGGFEFILKKLTAENFDWFLHSMLFIHTQQVIAKQQEKQQKQQQGGQSDDDDDDDDEV